MTAADTAPSDTIQALLKHGLADHSSIINTADNESGTVVETSKATEPAAEKVSNVAAFDKKNVMVMAIGEPTGSEEADMLRPDDREAGDDDDDDTFVPKGDGYLPSGLAKKNPSVKPVADKSKVKPTATNQPKSAATTQAQGSVSSQTDSKKAKKKNDK